MCKKWWNKTLTLTMWMCILELNLHCASLCCSKHDGTESSPALCASFLCVWDLQSSPTTSLLAWPSAVHWLEIECLWLSFGLSGFILTFLIDTDCYFLLVGSISFWYCTQNRDQVSGLKTFWENKCGSLFRYSNHKPQLKGRATSVHNRTLGSCWMDKSCFLN